MLGSLLHALGSFSVRFRWVVIIVWIALAIVMTLVVGRVGAVTSNDVALPGTGSQAAYDLLADRFPPQQNGGNPVVFHVTSGTLADNGPNQQAIVDTYNELAKLSYVSSITNPFENEAAGLVSDNGRYALMPVLLTLDTANLDEASAEEIYRIGTERGLKAGMEVAVGGPVGSTLSVQGTESSELIGLIAAMVILAFTFSSLVAMGLPILTAVFGLSVGLAIVGLFGHVISIASIAPTLATMIGLGVGIDYSLFLISKHREQMHRHGMAPRASIAEAVATSGGAIVFAGGTVMVALIALAVAGIPFVTSLGYACAIAVFTAVLAAITLLPAILAVLGGAVDRVHVPFMGRPDRSASGGTTVWTRWAGLATRHPVRSCVIAAVVLVPLMIPIAALTLGQEDIGVTSPETTERQAFDLISDGFGPGYNGPLVVAVTLDPPAQESAEYQSQYDEAMAMKNALEQTQATLTAEADELEAEQASLEAQAADLKRQEAALTRQAETLAKEAVVLRRQEARIRAEAGALTRQAERLRKRATLLQADTARLTARAATLTAELAELQAEATDLRAAIVAAAGNPLAEAALQRALGRVEALVAAATSALAVTQRELAANAKRVALLTRQVQTAAARAAEVAAEAATVQASAAKLEAQEADLRRQGATLQKQAASLTAQGNALQAEADDLEAQKEAAEAEQDQALALQDELTAEMTKAGGDARGTDPRIVKLQDALAVPDNVERVVQPTINKSGDAVILSIIAGTRPADPATADLVEKLRDGVIPAAIGPGMTASVGGTTAGNVDLATLITERLPFVILAVIIVSFLLLVVAFRSLLVAVQAAITNILSAIAAFGVLTLVFQNGHGLDLIGLDSPYGTVPIASYVPLMMFAALFGLSMDYEVFFVSHVQGLHAKGVPHAQAIRDGLASSAKVIGAAALIMMAVFGSFILVDDPVIKQFGVGLTTAVALAAFLVLFLAPAILLLFGERTWKLPRVLDRILPDLDLEGNRRAAATDATASAPAGDD